MATAIQITSCLTQARDRRRYGILTTTFSSRACMGQLLLLAGAWSRPNAKEEAKTAYEIWNFCAPDPGRFWTGTSTLALWRFVAARASIFGLPDRTWAESQPIFTAAVVLLGSSITRT